MPDLSPIQIRQLYGMAPEKAVKYLESLGVAIAWDWQLQLTKVKSRAFTIARVASVDALQTVLDELKKASTSGVSYKDWQKNTGDLLEQKGWAAKTDGSAWRLDTIFRTNMQSAYHAGRYEQMTGASSRFGYWEYRAVGDKRTRPKHRELDGLILPREHKFWKKVFPPNGYACRCTVVAITEKQALARGYEPPTGSNAVTPSGQKVNLDDWDPDDGFAGVPGQPLDPDLKKYETDLAADLKKHLDSKHAQYESLAKEQDPEKPTIPIGASYSDKDIDTAKTDKTWSLYYDRARKVEHPTMPPQERGSMSYYTSGAYEKLNRRLREDSLSTSDRAVTTILTEAIKRKAQPFKELSRVISVSDVKLPEFLEKYAEGKELEFDAFTSSTKTKIRGPRFKTFKGNILIKLRGEWKSGADVEEFSVVPGEREVLFAPGTKARVDAVYEILDGSGETWYRIELTEVSGPK